MKRLSKLFSIISALILLVFGNGKITRNVQFKDDNGKSYDLYQLLNSGKYIYFMGGYIG